MKPLGLNDIEAELSYAYLHAVAAQAGIACAVSSRHLDNAGIDARLTGWGPFPGGGSRIEVDLNVQLKATIAAPVDDGTSYSYFLHGTKRYNDLTVKTLATPRILVVLFLPPNPEQWLGLTEDELVLRRCSYWVSLRGADLTTNQSGATVKMPKAQTFTPNNLIGLMSRLSNNDIPEYQPA
jgi:hypothetical protein